MQGVVNDASPVHDSDFAEKDWGDYRSMMCGDWSFAFTSLVDSLDLLVGVFSDGGFWKPTLICCFYSPFAHGSHLYDYRTRLGNDFGQSLVSSDSRRY